MKKLAVLAVVFSLGGCYQHGSGYHYDAGYVNWNTLDSREKVRDYERLIERQRCQTAPTWRCIEILMSPN